MEEGGRPKLDAIQLDAVKVSHRVNQVANDASFVEPVMRGQMRLV